jgi:uncharacterized protein (TIGR03435 family)
VTKGITNFTEGQVTVEKMPGLKLDARKISISVVVVDHVEKPMEN